jgi:DNA-binding response OmpR family regulator
MVNSNRERKRILLVEDNQDAREIVAFNLEEYTVICACDFAEGLRLARRGYFDIYILDNWIPGGSGLELCRRIREFDPHTPILFYSACAYSHDLQAAFSAGAQKYLVKPVRFRDMTRTVDQLISVQSEKAFEARRAESVAIREELAIRRMETAELKEKAKAKHLRAEEKALRLKAEMAYLAAGGTRGDFAREWPSVFTEKVRGQRRSNTAIGN